MFIKRMLFALFVFFFLIRVSAQDYFREGFLITLENDTVTGKVAYRSNALNLEECLFKSEHGERVYTSGQIAGYGYLNDKFYKSQVLDSSFIEVLIQGKMSLYKHKNNYQIQKGSKIYNLKSGEDNSTHVARNKWRGIISFLISDCLNNSSEIVSRIRLDEKSLSTIVEKYNRCGGENFVVFKEDKPWTSFRYGISTGMTKSMINLNDLTQTEKFNYLNRSFTSFDPGVGGILELSFPRISENYSFLVEPNYMESHFAEAFTIKNGLLQTCNATYISLSTVSVPLSIKLNFPMRLFDLYFQIGGAYEYLQYFNSKHVVNVLDDNELITSEKEAFDFSDNQISLTGGVGLMKPFRHITFGAAIKYAFTDFNLEDRFLSVVNNKISFNLVLMR